jgi:hypothetical protein
MHTLPEHLSSIVLETMDIDLQTMDIDLQTLDIEQMMIFALL